MRRRAEPFPGADRRKIVDVPRLLIGSLVALLAAGLSLVQTLGAVTRDTNPALAVQLPIIDGLAYGNAAAHRYARRLDEKGTLDARPDLETMALARRAFLLEPLSSNAITILGLGASDERRRLALLEQAATVDKRNLLAETSLLDAYARRQQLDDILRTLDRILKVYPDQRSRYFPALIGVIASGKGDGELIAMFKTEPDWSDALLREAAGTSQAVENAARLRAQFAGLAISSPDTDRALLHGLIAGQHFAAASALYDTLKARVSASPDGEALQYPPYDWVFANSGRLSADSVTGGGISIHIARGEAGSLARRLVALQPGQYRAWARFASIPGQANPFQVKLQLTCADTAVKTNRLEIAVSDREVAGQQLTIPPGICAYFWVDLYGSAARSETDIDLVIQDLRLAGRRPASPVAAVRLS